MQAFHDWVLLKPLRFLELWFYKQFHQNVLISNNEHISGSDRIAEFAQEMEVDIIINVQGDEPICNPKDIKKIINYAKKNPEIIVDN